MANDRRVEDLPGLDRQVLARIRPRRVIVRRDPHNLPAGDLVDKPAMPTPHARPRPQR
jgi:hypothetical protein